MISDIYHSVDAVLRIFQNPQFRDDPNVVHLLRIFKDIYHKEKNKIPKDGCRKHPFIVIEGLDASGKATLTEMLATKLQADTCKELKQHVLQLKEAFDKNEQLRTAYYLLANYIMAMQITNTLMERPVVLDRYWHSAISYGIARAVRNHPDENKVPPYGDEIYKWPTDLLKPDIVLFISIRESVRLHRCIAKYKIPKEEALLKQDKNHRKNVVIVYQNITGTLLEYVDGNLPKSYVCIEAFDKIKHLLSEEYKNKLKLLEIASRAAQ